MTSEPPGTGSLSDIERDILAYVAEKPHAEDTIEGVADWWLSEHHAQKGRSEVQQALDSLVAKGLLLAAESPDRRTRYRANEKRIGQIQEILKR